MSLRTFCFALLSAVTLAAARDAKKPIDLYYVQDVSSPYSNKATIDAAVLKFTKHIIHEFPGSKIKLGSFSDVPLMPFGCDSNKVKDHCFKEVTKKWSKDLPWIEWYLKNKMKVAYGGDATDAANMAMNFAARTQFPKDNHRKVIMVLTDTGYHASGSLAKLSAGHYDEKCQEKSDCCEKIGATWATANITVVPNRNGANGRLECGYSKDGKLTKVFEDFPDEAEMYKYMADKDISVIAIPMIDHKALPKWVGYKKAMGRQGGKMAVRFGGELSELQTDALIPFLEWNEVDAARSVKDDKKEITMFNGMRAALEEILKPTPKPTPKPTAEPTAEPTSEATPEPWGTLPEPATEFELITTEPSVPELTPEPTTPEPTTEATTTQPTTTTKPRPTVDMTLVHHGNGNGFDPTQYKVVIDSYNVATKKVHAHNVKK